MFGLRVQGELSAVLGEPSLVKTYVFSPFGTCCWNLTLVLTKVRKWSEPNDETMACETRMKRRLGMGHDSDLIVASWS